MGPAAKLSTDSPELYYDDQNFLILAANPETMTRYSGYARTGAVYVVGYGTEHERLFHQGQGPAATSYASERRTTIRKAAAGNVCAEIMRAVLDGTYPSPVA